MKTDFEQWLHAQFAETGPFTIFIVLVRIAGDEVTPLKSSYAQLIGDDMDWRGMKDHFKPVGNPAPPRPRKLESVTVSMIACGSMPSALSSAR